MSRKMLQDHMLQTSINTEDKDIITVPIDIFSYIQNYEALGRF
jgi:hypothetical protein